jgi:hypothetical protein
LITMIATDSNGRTATDQVEIYPRAVNLVLASSPPGAPVSYGGTTGPAPRARPAAIGFVSSIAAERTFISNGTTYSFVGWSDGGARAHDITVPAGDTTITAVYEPRSWIEGEAMLPAPGSGAAIDTTPDPDASGGEVISFRDSPGSATGEFASPAPLDQVTLRMRGDECEGLPVALVSIDGGPARAVSVESASFADYSLALDPGGEGAAGTHTFAVALENGLETASCLRALHLDKASFHAIPFTAPAAPSPAAPPRSDTGESKSCLQARAQHRRLRRLVGRARRDARRAKARYLAGTDSRERLRRLQRTKERRLHQLERRLARAKRVVRARC